MKKNIENSDMPTSRPTTFAPRSVRRRNVLSGMSGCRVRDSMTMNVAMSATAMISRLTVCVEVQPADSASTSA
jgi:hypothetical protein